MDDIKDKVRAYLQESFGDPAMDPIQNDTPLLSSGIIDSISALTLVDFLEKNFEFEFEPHEVDRDYLDTVDLITDFVLSKTKS